jgi:hypothetical protein
VEPPGRSNGRAGGATGVEGTACYGATVAGPYLVVATEAGRGNGQLWAFDGTGGG